MTVREFTINIVRQFMKNKALIINDNSFPFKDKKFYSYYSIVLFEGRGTLAVNKTFYSFSGKTLLFLAPYENISWEQQACSFIKTLYFHSDFYCIEYHAKEIACNGLLFNNLYAPPYLSLNNNDFQDIDWILFKMIKEHQKKQACSIVLQSCLQLILALASRQKKKNIPEELRLASNEAIKFKSLLEHFFMKQKSVHFYALKLNTTSEALGKKVKMAFGKPPSHLIRERIILEAKKKLHLSFRSIKEIAYELSFEDQYYFSRYFKKNVGVSPLHYRQTVGISIAAK